jgi:hypothetical protein
VKIFLFLSERGYRAEGSKGVFPVVTGVIVQKNRTVSLQWWQGLSCRRIERCLSSGDRGYRAEGSNGVCPVVIGAIVQKDRTVSVQWWQGLLCRRIERILSNVAYPYALHCVLKFAKQLPYAWGVRGIKGSISGKNAELPKSLHRLWGFPSPLFKKTTDFPRVKSAGSELIIHHHYLAPSLRMQGTVIPLHMCTYLSVKFGQFGERTLIEIFWWRGDEGNI